jgi:DNA repair protein RadC
LKMETILSSKYLMTSTQKKFTLLILAGKNTVLITLTMRVKVKTISPYPLDSLNRLERICSAEMKKLSSSRGAIVPSPHATKCALTKETAIISKETLLMVSVDFIGT